LESTKTSKIKVKENSKEEEEKKTDKVVKIKNLGPNIIL
jgi:hypothetical protein